MCSQVIFASKLRIRLLRGTEYSSLDMWSRCGLRAGDVSPVLKNASDGESKDFSTHNCCMNSGLGAARRR